MSMSNYETNYVKFNILNFDIINYERILESEDNLYNFPNSYWINEAIENNNICWCNFQSINEQYFKLRMMLHFMCIIISEDIKIPEATIKYICNNLLKILKSGKFKFENSTNWMNDTIPNSVLGEDTREIIKLFNEKYGLK